MFFIKFDQVLNCFQPHLLSLIAPNQILYIVNQINNHIMMNKFLRMSIYSGMVLGAFSAGAQSSNIRELVTLPAVRPGTILPAIKPTPVTGFEIPFPAQPSIPAAAPVLPRNLDEETPGLTAYDRQSNGSEQKRLHVWPNGEVSAAFTFSLEQESANVPVSSYTDRGTGYNRRSQWLGGATPTARVETVRTGFTNYVVTEDGTEILVAHRSGPAGAFLLHESRRAAGASSWTESDLPSATPKGALWCKAATDGNNVYVLAITALVPASGDQSFIYKGMNGHLLFWRSTDAGLTWDIQDGIIPGVDSSKMASLSGDTYAIDAHDGTVAVAVFDAWNDALVIKSLDGGTSWETPTTIIDFPLTKYVDDQGYTVDDIGGVDPNGPSSTTDLEIFTSDGHVSVLVDNVGFVHVWAGRMWVLDDDLTDGNSSYYPGVNGLMYWNEYNSELVLMAGSPDLNGNDTLDINGTIIGYGSNISSMTTSAVSLDDQIYIAFSVVLEGLNDNAGTPLRHVYLLKSTDFGATWEDMFDVHYETNDPGLADFQEGVYPYFDKRLSDDGLLHLVYQRDYIAGASVTQEGAQPGLSDIVYVATNTITGTKNPLLRLEMSLSPNPAVDQARLQFNLPNSGDAQLDVFSALGVRVSTQQIKTQTGNNVFSINTATYANGLYFVRVHAGQYEGTTTLSVAK